MALRDVHSLSDEELRRACAPTDAERLLERLRLGVPLAGGAVLAVAAGIYLRWSWRQPLGLTLLVCAAVLLLSLASLHGIIDRLARRRRQPFRRELEWRYGRAPMQRYVEEVRQRLQRSHALRFVVLLQMRVRPHGGSHLLLIDLAEDLEAAQLEIRTVKGTPVEIESAHFQRCQGSLVRDEARPMIQIIASTSDWNLANTDVIDGCPCELQILDATGQTVARTSCNLAGILAEMQTHPTARLISLIQSSAARVGKPQLLCGASDSRGNILIGGV